VRALRPRTTSYLLARVGVLFVRVVGSRRQVSEVPAPACSSMFRVFRTRDLGCRVRWLRMAKQSESAVDELAAAQEKLKSAHAKLVKEFEKLHGAKFSAR
jgi:hypothetical protein